MASSSTDPYKTSRTEDYCPWSELRYDQCGMPCCRNSPLDLELLEANKP